MKKNRLLSGFLVVVLLVFSFGGAAFADEHENIVEVASASDDFNTLVAALEATGLDEALAGDGPFTVFAPTDAAFDSLLGALDITAEELLNAENLDEVLLYHVIGSQVLSTELTDGQTAETLLDGESLTFTVDEENDEWDITVNDIEVGPADIMASNGVIHVIGQVLIPADFELVLAEEDEEEPVEQNIVEIAEASDDFNTLVAALEATGLDEALAGDGPFTVFAPTDAAFESLLGALDITAEELLNAENLDEVLLYHVIGAQVLSTELTDGQTAETLLEGESLTFTVDEENGEWEITVNEIEVGPADIMATNGVIHVIGQVLIPADFELVLAEEDVPETGDIGMIPFVLAGIAGASGLWIAKKRK